MRMGREDRRGGGGESNNKAGLGRFRPDVRFVRTKNELTRPLRLALFFFSSSQQSAVSTQHVNCCLLSAGETNRLKMSLIFSPRGLPTLWPQRDQSTLRAPCFIYGSNRSRGQLTLKLSNVS